jgi:hypothetical protein
MSKGTRVARSAPPLSASLLPTRANEACHGRGGVPLRQEAAPPTAGQG